MISRFFMGLAQVEQFFRHRMYTRELLWGSGAGCAIPSKNAYKVFRVPFLPPQVRNLDKTLHIYMMNLGELYVIRGDILFPHYCQ